MYVSSLSVCALALDFAVAVAEFGSRDAQPSVPARRSHVRGEVDPTVVLHVLELVLLGRFHVDH